MSLLQYGQSRSCNETPLHLPTLTGKGWFLVRKDSNTLHWTHGIPFLSINPGVKHSISLH